MSEETTGERIAKVIARSGLCSRRDAERLIEEGRVTLNGQRLASPAVNVREADRIAVDGAPLPRAEGVRLWRYCKPKGRVTTHRDPEGRPTVFEALPPELPRVISVGRLDFNTEGLLLLTNDGGLARHLESPATGWLRRYRVRANGKVTQTELDALAGGVEIGGIRYGPIEAKLDRVQGANSWVTLAIREGKNREVRRIMEHLGLSVNRLIRLSFGPFALGELEPGQIEEVRRRVLADQLGPEVAGRLGLSERRQDRSRGRDATHPARGDARLESEAPRDAARKRARARLRRARAEGSSAMQTGGMDRKAGGREATARPDRPPQGRGGAKHGRAEAARRAGEAAVPGRADRGRAGASERVRPASLSAMRGSMGKAQPAEDGGGKSPRADRRPGKPAQAGARPPEAGSRQSRPQEAGSRGSRPPEAGSRQSRPLEAGSRGSRPSRSPRPEPPHSTSAKPSPRKPARGKPGPARSGPAGSAPRRPRP
jgi:23S rRNA pseudouridine2605 synthase